MSNEKILIVEDEMIVAEEIRHILSSMGYDVPGIASTGENAIRMAGDGIPDLVLMDIRLKGDMDGIEAANIIQERYSIPTIYLTAYSDEETIRRAKLTRPLGFIIKPLDVVNIRSVIEIALYRYKREKVLLESERLLSAAARSVHNGIVAIDDSGAIVYMNPAAGMLAGASPAKTKGRHIDDVMTIADINSREAAVGFFRQIMASDSPGPIRGSAVLRSGDGYEIPVSYAISPVTRGPGEKPGFIVIFHDISERLKIEKALQNDAMNYRSFIEDAGEGVMSLDAGHTILFVNQNMANMLGHSRDCMLGQQVFSYVSPRCVPDIHSLLWNAGKSIVRKCDIELVRDDGSSLWALATVNAMVNADGAYAGALIMVSDITGRKSVETGLIRAREHTRLYLNLIEKEIGEMNRVVIRHLTDAINVPDSDRGYALEKSLEILQSSSRLIEDFKKLYMEHEGEMPAKVMDVGREIEGVRKRYASEPGRVIINYEPVEGCTVIASQLIANMFTYILDSIAVHSVGPVAVGISVGKVRQDSREYVAVTIDYDSPAIAGEAINPAQEAGGFGLYRAKVLASCYGGDIRIEEKPDAGARSRLVILLPAFSSSGSDEARSPADLAAAPSRFSEPYRLTR